MPSSSSLKESEALEIDQPLYQVKLLSALRNGDPALIHPFLTEIGKDKRKSAQGDLDTGAAALHLAVRCASADTVTLLLAHRAISPNGVHPVGSGTTALHLAAALGRVDIVNLLLEQEGINDTLLDSHGRTCRDVARGKDVLRVIDDSREFLNASYRSLLRSYIMSPSSESSAADLGPLLALLESPRVRHINLSYLDDGSGSALLHEAAKRKDLRLIELSIRAGADVFVRNRRGKTAAETVGTKDDRVRVFLRQFANQDTTLLSSASLSSLVEPPSLKGYLNKYTNVAKGYNTRWFVLKAGVLSYYRHQEDETIASRGSISMRNCVIKKTWSDKGGTDRLRFEVHSTPSHGHRSAVQKWYMKANHHVEAARWAQAIERSIEWCKREHNNSVSDSERSRRRRSGESDSTSGGGAGSGVGTKTASLASSISLIRRPRRASTMKGIPTVINDSGEDSGNEGSGDDEASQRRPGVEDRETSSSASIADAESTRPPFESTFELHGNAVTAQLELTSQILNDFAGSKSGSSSVLSKSTTSSSISSKPDISALTLAFHTLSALTAEYITMSTTRSTYYTSQLKKEHERQDFWENSLAEVVKEGESLERQLRMRSRKRGSKFFDMGSGGGSVLAEPDPLALAGARSSMIQPNAKKPKDSAIPETEEPPSEPDIISGLPATTSLPATTDTSTSNIASSVDSIGQPKTIRSHTQETITPTSLSQRPSLLFSRSSGYAGGGAGDHESMISTDDEDEFFDAIESNTLPNLVVPEPLNNAAQGQSDMGSGANEMQRLLQTPEAYDGYQRLREKLNLAEERPSTSLWSVLKNSIGKDLTKISFPVFFNEPTSMLQRMAEDMEFSECLDIAARESDPHRRLAFVAAFAMSNYSSTIGRIAKPFNPMLSETFEYVRFDKEYRYVSEQVSHHPPISACWAESPRWHYYGEVDAQNKFMGKSFEIRPTGVAHAELLLSPELGPGYPKATAKREAGKVVEHYSWKKVTTNVSGFILGSPTIDHYGDMTIINHRTRDKCVLTFKPRGWRGRDAFEISGHVMDRSGNVIYEIAGRWNSQLIARHVGSGSGLLNPDLSVSGPTSPSATPEYILLWRNSEKVEGSPFNLTPFAITLNDCPRNTLKPYICPTDCRLRVDQRAFEMGKWEIANGLKNDQEEKQRAIRKQRELGVLPKHKPRWFTAETDGDTGERVWAPSMGNDGVLSYWAEKENVWRQSQTRAGTAEWKDVDSIFIEEPDFIKLG